MHGAAIAALGLDATYDARNLEPHELPTIVAELRDGRWRGLNVTLPHKVAVLSLCDRVDADARVIGAVNTLSVEGGSVIGTNTDVLGLYASIAPYELVLRGGHVVILGAGGAARAAVAVARRLDASSITIAARNVDKAALDPFVSAVSFADRASLVAAFAGASLVVQATSATMGPGADAFVDALPLEALAPRTIVTDLVYRPRRTRLLDACEARDLVTIDGTEMLVQQGAASLSRWLGHAIDTSTIGLMRRAVLDALS
jgi:shikimate dehydrogenase